MALKVLIPMMRTERKKKKFTVYSMVNSSKLEPITAIIMLMVGM